MIAAHEDAERGHEGRAEGQHADMADIEKARLQLGGQGDAAAGLDRTQDGRGAGAADHIQRGAVLCKIGLAQVADGVSGGCHRRALAGASRCTSGCNSIEAKLTEILHLQERSAV